MGGVRGCIVFIYICFQELLSVKRMWRETAGRRPPQPIPERACYFEEQWAKYFSDSEVSRSRNRDGT